jgi:hypothetical protein
MSTTVPDPFQFHNPKSTASMRRYLDSENQMINPTLKPRSKSALYGKSHSPVKARDARENPAITSKFSAYVQKRRADMEGKKQVEEEKFQEDVQRFFKQNRLAQRVKCSPALVSTS